MAPDVDDLTEEPGPVPVHGLHHAAEGGDAARVVTDHALGATDAGGMHANRLEDDEPHPTPRLLGVIVDVTLARQVIDPVVRRVGGDEDAIAQLEAADAIGSEDVRKRRGRHPPRYWPPLTSCPVKGRASSEARKTAIPATSSGWPMRPSGTWRAISWISASLLPSRGWAVSVRPGAMALTRMPWEASSRAMARVRPTTPALLAT